MLSLIGIISLRFRSLAACSDKASLNFTWSSPSFLIILAMPAVETVIRLGAMFKPSGEVIRSTDCSTLS